MDIQTFKQHLNDLGIIYTENIHPDFRETTFPYDHVLEVNGGVGFDYCYTQFYFLDGKYIGYGSYDN
jgi:hypothetical protein